MSFAERNKSSPLVLPPPQPNLNENLGSLDLPVYSHADLLAARDEDQYEHGPRILVGLKDYVFDVTPLMEFLIPGGQLSNYAGKDISFALTKASNRREDTTVKGYGTLSSNELKMLDEWTSVFLRRFTVVGRLEMDTMTTEY
ncbi:hypothetical protein C8F04DRAFT_1108526 [Mycena alexandri]|uniref:Cytochrome b5 heme-binding domain-containing protein n=1 Tax=Mycena alexandri TaxID=1745969 RepID=A0AAD6SS24_9AGAR|nr:hypothetical protein C8F04DRAFT_1108526 [Mycena alexandri]